MLTFVPLSLLILFESPGMGTDFLELVDLEVDTNGLEPGHGQEKSNNYVS